MACMKNWKVTHSTSCSGEVIALEGTALLALVIVEGALVAVTDDHHTTHFCTTLSPGRNGHCSKEPVSGMHLCSIFNPQHFYN